MDSVEELSANIKFEMDPDWLMILAVVMAMISICIVSPWCTTMELLALNVIFDILIKTLMKSLFNIYNFKIGTGIIRSLVNFQEGNSENIQLNLHRTEL